MQKNISQLPVHNSHTARQFEHMLQTLSHELRNPLNAIYGMSQILKKLDHLDENVKKSIDVIYQSSRDVLPLLDYISNHLLANPMVQQKPLVTFNLLMLLESLLDKHYPDAQDKQTSIFLAYDNSVSDMVSGYQDELHMIISFLINNAIRFTEKGEIFIGVTVKSIPGQSNNMYRITVRDTGCGIETKLLEHIFDLFVPEKSTELNYNPGLKLSISQQILSSLGGEIEIYSKPNFGTKVTIDIPMRPVSASAPKTKSLWDTYRDNIRLLIIESDERVGDIIKQYLSAKETHVISPTNACSALKSAFMQRKPYQMVVIDEKLLNSQLDGLLDLLATFPHHFTPFFVVFSDTVNSKNVELLANEVVVSHILKPLKPSKLTQQIAIDWCNYKNRNTSVGINSNLSITPRILLVEDNKNNIAVEKMMLESLGCKVDVALNGDEALEYVRNHSNYYHLVFLDIGLPGKLGYEVAPLLKDLAVNGVKLPIVAMTAYVSESDIAKCHRAGIVDVVAKPATLEKLEATLKEHITNA